MGDQLRLVWFSEDFSHHETHALFVAIYARIREGKYQLVSLFLDNVLTVLREELSRLGGEPPPAPLNLFDLISTIESDDNSSGGLLGSYRNFLMVVLNIALFIGNHEDRQTQYTDLVRPCLLLAALGAGMLPAAAVAASTCLADLTLIGPEVARIAFRIGMHIHQVSSQLEPASGERSRDSCVYAVTSLTLDEVEEEVASFNSATKNENLTRLYISSSDKASTTVTGPPSRLKQAFRHSEKLRYSKWTALPVYDGLAHAPHLYNDTSVKQILQGVGNTFALSSKPVVPLLSSHTGQAFSAQDGHDLLAQVTWALLTMSVHTDRVQQGIRDHILKSSERACDFLSSQKCYGSRLALHTVELILSRSLLTQQDVTAWTRRATTAGSRDAAQQSKLAIVGMSCRMPGGADNPELLWQLLMDGRDTCKEIPKDRFDLDVHYDATGETVNATKIRYGNFIDNPGRFDAAFFNMSPREADNTDPAARLGLVTAYEALEMAGYSPNRTQASMTDRIGAYLGQASDDWRELNASQQINAFIVPGGVRAFACGRINYFFKFGGPSINIDTACSSSLAAVHAACSALWSGQIDMAIAGGVNVITDPDNYCGLGAAGFLSPSGQCKVWDASADGYCRGDGIGTIVIKRLADAEADNDNILAVILSAATNHSANAPSITHPDPNAQTRNYRRVVTDAGINALDVTYAELHGTGTQAGDVTEAQSIEAVFAPAWPRRGPDRKLLLGAVKSNIGHGEAAAGIASLIKSILCFQHDTIPKHIGIRTRLNPEIPVELLGCQGARLQSEHTAWPRPTSDTSRLAVVNSFGAHGGNTTLLLEDAPRTQSAGVVDPRDVFPIVVSAKSRQSLRQNLQNLLEHLNGDPDISLGDLSYTLTARRMHHNLRMGTYAASVADVKSWLSTSLHRADTPKPVLSRGYNVVFVFSGQGSYYEGIARQLIQESAAFRREVSQLNGIATSLGFPISSWTGDRDTATPTASSDAQLTLTIIQIALVRYLDSLNVSPSLVIGHSLGEYAAFVACGILSATDAIMLVGKRAQLLQQHCVMNEHGLLAARLPDASSSHLWTQLLHEEKGLELACFNDSLSVVIGGRLDDLERATHVLEQRGCVCTTLQTPFAFHTSQVDPILVSFATLAETIPFHPPRVPYLSPLLKRTIFDATTINGHYLRRACRESVDFKAAVDSAIEEKLLDANTIFCELGSHPVLLRSLQNLVPTARGFPTLSRTESNWKTLTKALVGLHCAGITVRWQEHFSQYERAHRLCNLPAYAWNDKDHWIPYTGRWTLDKGLTEVSVHPPKRHKSATQTTPVVHKSTESDLLRNPLIHTIVSDEAHDGSVRIVTLSDIAQSQVLAGHRMNDHNVASSSVWCSMAFAVSKYALGRLAPDRREGELTILNLQVSHAQVLSKEPSRTHWIRLQALTERGSDDLHIEWFHTDDTDSCPGEAFASCTVSRSQKRIAMPSLKHLVMSRVEELDQRVLHGSASVLSKEMAYSIFRNVVDYSPDYQGMEKVVMMGYEAYASVRLSTSSFTDCAGPSPCWIDAISHLAGLVMNGSERTNTRDYVWVTPGFEAFRLVRPLQSGISYISYVKMAPTNDARIYAGDVFVMSDGEIVGILEHIKFRQLPRILVKDMFSPDSRHGSENGSPLRSRIVSSHHQEAEPVLPPSSEVRPPPPDPMQKPGQPWPVGSFLQVLVNETGLEMSKFGDDSEFTELGVDSLMSLVITTKLRENLGIDIKHSLFLENETVGKMKQWLLDSF